MAFSLVLPLIGCATLASAAPELPRPVEFGLGPQGFSLGSVESGFQLRIRGALQADGRFFPDAHSPPLVDTFLIRRARPIIEGTVAEVVDFRLMPEFGQGKVQLLDAFFDFRIRPWAVLRAGKFKSPFGLERLQNEVALLFIERGLSSNLVPDRDIGLTLRVDLGQGMFQAEAGVVDGTADNASLDADADSAKEVVARVMVRPLGRLARSPARALGVGGAVTYGRAFGSSANPQTPAYLSDGQQGIFSYRTGAFAHGEHLRLSPQGQWYFGPVGAFAEWVWSAQGFEKDGRQGRLIHRAWQVAGSVVLRGGSASYEGVKPTHPFDVHKRQLGAVELAVRYGELRLDPHAFPDLADPQLSVRQAEAWAVGLNWYLSANAKAAVNFERTTYAGGAPAGDREPENALLTRLQVAF